MEVNFAELRQNLGIYGANAVLGGAEGLNTCQGILGRDWGGWDEWQHQRDGREEPHKGVNPAHTPPSPAHLLPK